MPLVQVEWRSGFYRKMLYVNGEVDDRRGRKLRNGDVINIPGCGRFQIVGPTGQ